MLQSCLKSVSGVSGVYSISNTNSVNRVNNINSVNYENSVNSVKAVFVVVLPPSLRVFLLLLELRRNTGGKCGFLLMSMIKR